MIPTREKLLHWLHLIDRHGQAISGLDFARAAFPNSPAWLVKSTRPDAVAYGRMKSAASGVLGQLEARSLLDRVGSDRWILSRPGYDFLLRRGVPSVVGGLTRVAALDALPLEPVLWNGLYYKVYRDAWGRRHAWIGRGYLPLFA